MAEEYTAEIGRALGWDLAYYGWSPREDAPREVIEGHTAGKAHHGGRTKHPTRFERKWLQLRQNALSRGRVVDRNVTPQFIEFIDYPTCPVTLVELTHGTGEDTDWSVDRVNNDGAYAEGNLVVMSTRANKAKGDKSFLDVTGLAADGLALPGLSVRETLRMRCLMEGPCRVSDYGEPRNTLWTRLCRGSTRTDYQSLQHILLMAAGEDSTHRNRITKKLSVAHVDSKASANLLKIALASLVNRLKTADYPYDACGDVDFQSRLKRWAETIPACRKHAFKAELDELSGSRVVAKETLRGWALDTKGRYPA
ncbi:hypothetical protein AB4Y45_22845 [Paraburkholderia sp. EG287A]|uniref:hypothetical protein n=1 Tax=Paraburkholderia sp. EG287A TaxID=3237012 RepID=UPI0034D1B3C6